MPSSGSGGSSTITISSGLHQGIEGLVPADRFFGAAAEVKRTLAARVAANAAGVGAERGAQGAVLPDGPGGRPAVQRAGEGERVILTGRRGRQEIDLAAPAGRDELPEPVCPAGVVSGVAGAEAEEEPAPGTSLLDEAWRRCRRRQCRRPSSCRPRREVTHEHHGKQ